MQVQRLEVDAGAPPGIIPGAAASRRAGRFGIFQHTFDLILRTPADDLVATVFPGDCRLCDGPILRASAVPVCEGCLQAVHPDTPLGCSRCGDSAEFASGLGVEDASFASSQEEIFRAERLCRGCRLAPPAFARAVSFGVYDDELRELIHLFKFDGIRALAERLGGYLADAVLKLDGEASPELLVVPVPLFRARLRERGFNQAALVAEVAIRRLARLRPGWRLELAQNALIRQRSTEAQYELSRSGRRRNLRGAFAVSADVRGREVLLVDDILTSGATARECARVLVAAGASQVWVATVARAGMRSARMAEPDVAAWDLVVPTHGGIAAMHGVQRS